jgi:hypothetical protein
VYSAAGLIKTVRNCHKNHADNQQEIRNLALKYASFAGISLGNIPKGSPGGIARRGETSVRAKLQNGSGQVIQNPNAADLPKVNQPMYLNIDPDEPQFTLSQTNPLSDPLEFAQPLIPLCEFEREVMQWMCACIVHAYHSRGGNFNFGAVLHNHIDSEWLERDYPPLKVNNLGNGLTYGSSLLGTGIFEDNDATWSACIELAARLCELYAAVNLPQAYSAECARYKAEGRSINDIMDQTRNRFETAPNADRRSDRANVCAYLSRYLCRTHLFNADNTRQLLYSMITQTGAEKDPLYVGRFFARRGHGAATTFDLFTT